MFLSKNADVKNKKQNVHLYEVLRHFGNKVFRGPVSQ